MSEPTLNVTDIRPIERDLISEIGSHFGRAVGMDIPDYEVDVTNGDNGKVYTTSGWTEDIAMQRATQEAVDDSEPNSWI